MQDNYFPLKILFFQEEHEVLFLMYNCKQLNCYIILVNFLFYGW